MKENMNENIEKELEKLEEDLSDRDVTEEEKHKWGKIIKEKKEENIEKAKQTGNYVTTTLLIVGKGMKTPKEAKMPEHAINSLPKMVRNTKLPMVRAKVGKKLMTLVCEKKAYDNLVVFKKARVKMAGMVIEDAKTI